MKYTAEQVKAMSWREWAETMARELNEAGFKHVGITSDPETHALRKELKPYSVEEDADGPKLFLLGSVESSKEIDYLKNIGLLNNGRCPMCGNMINGSPGRFTSGYDPNYHFQVCQNCVQKRENGAVNPANQGCIVALLFIPFNLIKHICLTLFS